MTADFDVILNFNSATPVKTGAEFKAGDKGFTINMDVRELDPTGMTPKIAFYRSNGTSVESAAVTNVGNIFSYTLLGNELAVPGVVVADLKFYDGDDQRVSSASFIFTAISDTLDGLGGGTESYSDELEQLSAEFQDTLDDYIDAFGNTAPINPRGDYDNAETYEPRDMVYDSNTGTSWVCKQQSTGNAPGSPSAYWQKLVNSSGSANLGDLADVDTTGATAGQLLGLGNNNEWGPVNAPATGVTSFNSRTGAVTPISGDYTSAKISYDNTSSGLAATDVQDAVDELKGNINNIHQEIGSKNLLPVTGTTTTISGVTFTVNADGSVTVSGGASAGAFFNVHYFIKPGAYQEGYNEIYNKTLILSGTPAALGALGCGLSFGRIDEAGNDVSDLGSGVTFTYTRTSASENSYVGIWIPSGVNFANPVTFFPMLRESTIADDTWEPYGQSKFTNKKDLTSIIATGSTNTTGATIKAGTFFYLNGTFVKAIADIATNASFTSGTNYQSATVGDELSKINCYTPADFNDFNSLTLQGNYRIDVAKANVSNAPSVSGNYVSGFATVMVFDARNSFQIFYDVINHVSYMRAIWNGNYTSWNTF